MAESVLDGDSAINKTAIFLGYVSQSIDTEYYSDRGESTSEDCIDFINLKSGQNYYLATIDYDYVNSEIGAGRAVLGFVQDSNGAGGHVYIIDKKKVTHTSSTSTYGWVGEDNTGEDSNEYDEEGNLIGYSYYFVKENKIESTDYFMNWGWNGSYDGVACTASSGSDWNIAKYNLNSARMIARQ